jgi:hypothetical protein
MRDQVHQVVLSDLSSDSNVQRPRGAGVLVVIEDEDEELPTFVGYSSSCGPQAPSPETRERWSPLTLAYGTYD